MSNGPGVSATERPDGRWRVRWRERVRDEDGSERWASRERVVADERTALKLRADILHTIELGQLPDLTPVRVAPATTTVDNVLGAWARRQRAKGNRAPSTLASYVTAIRRILRELREEHRIPADRPVPGHLLTPPSVVRLTERLQAAGLAAGSVYPTIRVLVAAWVWACDDPATFPGLAPAPRDLSNLLPASAEYAPGTPPTLAEVDAMLRELAKSRSRIALPAAVVMRYTGLRIGAVLVMQAGDVNLSSCSVLIRGGKSAREKLERRTVAMSPHLRDYLVPMLADRPADEKVLRHRSDVREGHRRAGPSDTIRAAWEAATVAGHVRREVWDASDDRRHARPDHAIRAAVITHLRTAGVDRAAVKVLAGQALDLQERFYVGNDHTAITRPVVGLIPPIDFGNVESLPANVHKLR